MWNGEKLFNVFRTRRILLRCRVNKWLRNEVESLQPAVCEWDWRMRRSYSVSCVSDSLKDINEDWRFASEWNFLPFQLLSIKFDQLSHISSIWWSMNFKLFFFPSSSSSSSIPPIVIICSWFDFLYGKCGCLAWHERKIDGILGKKSARHTMRRRRRVSENVKNFHNITFWLPIVFSRAARKVPKHFTMNAWCS